METLYHVEFWTTGALPWLSHNGIMTVPEAMAIADGRRVVVVRPAAPDEERCGLGEG